MRFRKIIQGILLLFCGLVSTVLSRAQVAGFTADVTSGCSPLVVSFHNTSTGATNYIWNFGNGTPTSAFTDGSSTFYGVGSYTVTLTAYNGTTDSNKFSGVVTVKPNPVAGFFAVDTADCPGTTISFTSTSVANVPGPLTYTWSFGDGNASTLSSPANNYVLPGHYTVSLIVTNSAGCVSNDTIRNAYVHIFSPPAINYHVSDSFFCTAPGAVNFFNSTTGTEPLTHTWRLGDGTLTVAPSPAHSYTTAGTYSVSLVVSDAHSCTDSVVKPGYIFVNALTASFSSTPGSCIGRPDTFYNTSSSHISSHWDFGDGFTTTDDAVIHAFSAPGTYTVTLAVFDGSCYDTVSHLVSVPLNPTGDFRLSTNTPCFPPGFVTFTATVPSGCTASWLFGDRTTATGLAYTKRFPYGVIDSAYLTVTDAHGCSGTIGKLDTINFLVASVNFTAIHQCVPDTTAFNISAMSKVYLANIYHYLDFPEAHYATYTYPYAVSNYHWVFGDGTSSPSASPTHEYTAVGTYTATCTITMANGCSKSDSTVIDAGSNSVCSFTVSPTHACPGQLFSFAGSSVGVVTAYSWTFDDGTSDSGPESAKANVRHAYSSPGLYYVTLTTFNGSCPSNIFTLPLTVDSPGAVMHMNYDCIDRNVVTFSNASHGADSVTWQFGDGSANSSLSTITHSYPATGWFDAKLFTYNARSGCRDTASNWLDLRVPRDSTYIKDPRDSAICEYIKLDSIYAVLAGTSLQMISYVWYVAWAPVDSGFADMTGVTLHRGTISARGLIPVSSVLTDSHGCRDTGTYYVRVAKPIDSFMVDPAIGCAPLSVHFSDLTTDVPGTTIVRHFWSFGYGDTSSFLGASPYKTFDADGIYNVEEIVMDNLGCKDTIMVSSAVRIFTPHASFYILNSTLCTGVSTSFVNTSSGFTRALWMFGDGDTSAVTSPTHIYTAPGSYTIKLVCFNGLGCNDTFSVSGVSVNPSPHASFFMSDSFAVCPPLTVAFTNTSTGALSSGYKWYFGEGDSSVAFDPSWLYTIPGLYTVKLVAVNAYGCADTGKGHANLFGYPNAFTYTPHHGCSPMTVRFAGLFAGAVSAVTWDFGDGSTYSGSLADTISHTYPIGAYIPKLLLTSSGCATTTSVGTDMIKADTLTAAFTAIPDPVCQNSSVTFRDSSYGRYSSDTAWSWNFGTGVFGSVANPSYVYTTAATYPVNLVVTNSYGCTRAISKNVVVESSPSRIAGVFSVCARSTTTLSDTAVGGVWSSTGTGILSIGSSSGIVTGIAPGTTVVTYEMPGGCMSTAVIRVNPSPSFIAGSSEVCTAVRIILTDTISGGRWTSSNTLVAQIGSITGVVTGVTAGTAIITYRLLSTGNCYVTRTEMVNSVPSLIDVPGRICTGAYTTLVDTTTGGIWTSANPAIALIGSSSGIVTGITPGTVVISYATGLGCLTATTVNVTRFSSNTGLTSACPGGSSILSNSTSGGYWSSGASGIATVNSSSGLVTGISAGTVLISYTLGGCSALITYMVNPLPAPITGTGVCIGFPATLTDSSAGGTWVSGTPGVASIVSASGLLTGVTAGTTLITYILPTGCRITGSIGVGPLPPAISGDSAVCSGLTAVVADSRTGGSWSCSDISVAVVGSSIGIISGIASGTARITYSVNGCPVSKVFTVNPLPGDIFGGDACVGQSTILSDTSSGGTWASASTGIATIGPHTGIVIGVSAGTVTITYMVATGCIATFLESIKPIPPPVTGPATLCQGNTVTLGDTGPGGVWSSSLTGIATVGSGTGVVTGISAGTTTVSYLVNGCPALRTEVVNALPDPITGPDTMCEGGATAREFETTLSGAWTSIFVTVDTTGLVTSYASGQGIVSYTLGTGCFITKTITIIPVPGLITGPTYVCIDSTVTLIDATTGGHWSCPGFGDILIGSATGSVTGVSTGTALITYTAPTGCISTRTIEVNPQPHAIAGAPSVCAGSTITFSDLSPGGFWSTSSGGTATIGSASGIVAGVAVGSAVITYSINYLCGPAIVTKGIVVNPGPVAGAIYGDSVVCVGSRIALGDTSGGPGTWRSSNGTASLAGDTVSAVRPGIDTIYYSVTNVCGTAVAEKSMTILPLPAASRISGDSAVCVASFTTLSDGIPSGVWSSLNAAVSIGSNSGLVTGIRAGTTIVSYTVSNYCGASTVIHNVLVSPLPDSGKIVGDTSICSGSSTLYSNAAPRGTWRSGNPGVATIGGAGGLQAMRPGADTLFYSVTNVCGTAVSDLAIAVHPSPENVHITIFPDSNLCANSLYQNFGTDSSASPGEYYTWSASNGGVVYANSPGHQNCLVNFNAPGISVVKLTAGFPGANCFTSDSIVYDVNGFFVPDPGVVYYEPELVCTDNTSSRYQWGYDDAVTLDSTIFPGEINQNYYNANLDLAGKYYWVLTYHSGCIQKSYYNAPLKVSYFTTDKIKILLYPNPADNKLNITVQGIEKSDLVTAELYDVLGQALMARPLIDGTGSMFLTGYAPGIYMVTITRNGLRVGSGSFIKN